MRYSAGKHTPAMLALLRKAAEDPNNCALVTAAGASRTARTMHTAGLGVYSAFEGPEMRFRIGDAAVFTASAAGLEVLRDYDQRTRLSSGRIDARQGLTQKFLREAFDYDPITGVVRWRTRPLDHFVNEDGAARWNGKFPGRQVGARNGGHSARVHLGAADWSLPHIIWFMVHGDWPMPPYVIVAKDGDRFNMALDNLHLVDQQTLSRQTMPKHARSASGVSGVNYAKRQRKWRASIHEPNNPSGTTVLGFFDTKEEAAAARRTAAERLGYAYEE